jgi:HK97 family phage major capsid protein
MYALIDISNQMLEDSAFDMEAEIRGEATEQFAVKEGAEIRGTVRAGQETTGIGAGKTKRNFASIVALTAGFILVKSVHTA